MDQLPESILHSNVEFASLVNWKVADWLLVGSLGPDVILTTGSVTDVRYVKFITEEVVLPVGSVATTFQ